MKPLTFLLFLYLLSVFTSYSQTLNRTKLDSLFNILSKNNLAMASVAISKNGKILYQKAIGSAIIDGDIKTPADKNTAYRIGSITKMFTAVIIFQLFEEKKLFIDNTLYNYFPLLPNARLITLGNLLNHRSGLSDFTKDTNYPDWMDKPKTSDELLTFITNRKTDFEPNDKADYNNSNYLILSYIIEKVCKKPYKDVLQERIIDKLALTKTSYGSGQDIDKNECASYKYFDNKWIKDKKAELNNFSGAGAIISTPVDMTKFIEALFSYKLVSKTSLDKMKTLVDGYGMGMFPYSFQSKNGFGHNGKTEGFASSLSYYPKEKLAIAYCTNGEMYPKADILNSILSICFNPSYIIPSFTPVALNDQALNKYLGTYISDHPPIKVVCTKNNTNLVLETKGQILIVDALGNDKFMNSQFGFFFEFNQASKQLLIKERDNVYYLNKEFKVND